MLGCWSNKCSFEFDSQNRGERVTCATPRTCTSVSRRDAWGRARELAMGVSRHLSRGHTCRTLLELAKGWRATMSTHPIHFPLYICDRRIYIYIYIWSSWVFSRLPTDAGILKWNKLEIFRAVGGGRILSTRASDQPFCPKLAYHKRGCESAKGASHVSITTIAVLTHLSLSFIAQFDIKRQRYTVVHEPGRWRGRFFNRLHSAAKCHVSRGWA